MSKGHKNKNKRRNMTTVNNIAEDSQLMDTTSTVVEVSVSASQNIEVHPKDTDVQDVQSSIVEENHQDEAQDTDAIMQKIANLQDLLNKLRSDEEYAFYVSSTEFLSDVKKRYNNIQSLIQKANIAFESLNSDISTIITEAKIFEKNFDVLCLFKSPDINKEAKDWFSSLSGALDLMEKAMKGEKDENLGRIPPTNFRACIKNSSQFDPIYTMSVSTPIYRVKAGTCTDDFFPTAWKGANSFSLHSKYLLNTEQKLKSVRVMILSESENDKNIKRLCLLPTIDGDRDPIKYLEDLETKLESITLDIELKDLKGIEELETIDDSLKSFSSKLTEINNILYERKEKITDSAFAVEKQFYKVSLSDLLKMYNDITKLIQSFEITVASSSRDDESKKWHDMLLEMKSKMTDYLNRLGIYENETIIENETIWKDDMDFIEILEGEDDNTKPEGQISKINSIGFHYIVDENKKEYIEKTKVFVYRKN